MNNEAIHSESGQARTIPAHEVLEDLRVLAIAIERAMEAIVKRELLSLQDSLRLQQTTCARLVHADTCTPGGLLQHMRPDQDFADADLAPEIKAASQSLLVLNRRYAALLKHSEDTLRLFAGLFRSYHGSGQTTAGIGASLQTWSCEL